MTADNETKIQGGLHELADKSWFSKNKDSAIWVRIYKSLGLPHKDFSQKLSEIKFGSNVKEFRLAHGQIHNMEIPLIIKSLYTLEDGKLFLEFNIKNKILLPNTNYIFFAAPFTKENEIKATFDEISALIKLHFGNSFIHEIAYEGSVKNDGKQNHSTDAVKMPFPCEGPFISQANWSDTTEIRCAIGNIPTLATRERIKLSLRYFNRAMQEDDFALYCIAMDLFCGSKSIASISAKIQKCYGFKTTQEAEMKTGFSTIKKWRNDFLHHGIYPPITADTERYIQLLFLDVLRFELKLEHKGHALNAKVTYNLDLKSLNLC